jgi:hypothetical protein
LAANVVPPIFEHEDMAHRIEQIGGEITEQRIDLAAVRVLGDPVESPFGAYCRLEPQHALTEVRS